MSEWWEDRGRGFVAGVAGDIAGTLAMQAYWRVVRGLAGEDPREETVPGHEHDSLSPVGRHHREGESSTAAAGRIAFATATGAEPGKGT